MFKKLLILIVVGIALGTGIFYLNKKSEQGVQVITPSLGVIEQAQDLKQTLTLMPTLLGYDKPQTYLVLFLNNTEIRPGGGFIGSYALVRLDKRQITMFETSGSENLDWAATSTFSVEPPRPIKQYLKQPKWYFRDSNWSPDFSESAKQAIKFYQEEGGKEGYKIDTVIGITPTVVEKLMARTGPITIVGKTFTADNFTEALEYHVEYGYRQTGIDMSDRKTIMGDLGREFIKKITNLSAGNWAGLWSDFLKLASERQIMMYSVNVDAQKLIEKNNWSGKINYTTDDYFLVVDANLASLKTDPAVFRKITYQVRPDGEKLKAKIIVEYDHRGNFDWRTTRYRTYTRVYAPLGSKLISSDGYIDENKKPALAETFEDLGKTVFGGFMSIEPQTKKILTLEYYLPINFADKLKKGLYKLFVQKQLGTRAFPLTIDLDFGKTVGAVNDRIFHQETNLNVDREFEVKF